jgi:hypothetical protein
MTQLGRPEGCLTDLTLDTWSGGELDRAATERASAHTAVCERCRCRRAVLDAERVAFYAAADSFSAHATQVRSGRHAQPRQAGRWAFGGVLAALAATATLVLMPGRLPGTRQKGGPSLSFFVKRSDHVLSGSRSLALHPGDMIRFAYSSESPSYLALFNRDARSTGVYFPSGPGSSRAARVKSGSEVALDFSVELDDVLGDEQVHALFCPEPFELGSVLTKLRETGKLPVPTDCQDATLTLHKVRAP